MKAINLKFYFFLPLFILISSCAGKNEKSDDKIDEEILDPTSSLNTNFDGKIFSIPSPVQTSMLIKDANIPYTPFLLNSPDNVNNYISEVKKALNLGVYGTDLGYCSLYEQHSTALKYLKCVEKITKDLNLEGAFDRSFMERFEKNNTNQDSVVRIVTEAFTKADNFLKNNDRKNSSVLILVGGWVESIYLACELSRENFNKKIVDRIGEQQQTLSTIIEILDIYNKNGINTEILNQLEDLKLSFNLVKIEYDYVPPSVDEAKKTTTLEHSTKVVLNSNVLNMISMKIYKIRSSIVE
jgi:hypothetical protein